MHREHEHTCHSRPDTVMPTTAPVSCLFFKNQRTNAPTPMANSPAEQARNE